MSTPTESPAQRAARQRRERREAKIKEGGSARLDKITNASGRTPQSVREEGSPSPQTGLSPSPSPAPQIRPSPSPQPQLDTPSQESLQAQQEYFRALLRQGAPDQGQGQGQGPGGDEVEDPTLKLLNSLMDAVPLKGDPNAAPAPGGGAGDMPGLSPAGIASALGMPPWIASLVGGATQSPTEEEQKQLRVWKALHVIFALGVAFYLLFVIVTSVATFGSSPPKPATAQNPFMVFVTGELLLTGGRVLLAGNGRGVGMAVQLFRDVVRDGSLVLFMLGMGSWYYREWQGTGY